MISSPTRFTGDFLRHPQMLLHTSETKFDMGIADIEASTSLPSSGSSKDGKSTKRGRKPNTPEIVQDGTLPVDPTLIPVSIRAIHGVGINRYAEALNGKFNVKMANSVKQYRG